MEWKKFTNKKVFVKLRDGSCYTGLIDFVDDTSLSACFITIIDKYGKYVTFNEDEILKIVEEDSR